LKVSEYVKAKSLDEAYELLIENKKNYIIAGGAWIKLSIKTAEKFISLEDLNLDKVYNADKRILEPRTILQIESRRRQQRIAELRSRI